MTQRGRFSVASVLICAAITATVLTDRAAATGQLVSFAIRSPGWNYLRQVDDGVTYVMANTTGLNVACFCSPSSTVEIFRNLDRIRSQSACEGILFHKLSELTSGNYSCRYSDGNITTITLRVIEESEITVTAPEVQYGVLGQETDLQCEAATSLSIHTVAWKRSKRLTLSPLQSISLLDQGEYKCEIYFAEIDVHLYRTIQLVVLVPPTLVSIRPSPQMSQSSVGYLHYTSNSDERVVVNFDSKFTNETRIQWYRNDVPISSRSWTYELINLTHGQTTMNFRPIRRSDAGDYRVEITNNNNNIPLSMRTLQVRIAVLVSIEPSIPQSLSYDASSQHLSWEYSIQTEDLMPDQQLIRIRFTNNSLAQTYALDGNSRHVDLSALIPATEYTATVTGSNQDGHATSDLFTFSTVPAAPSVRSVTVQRSENDTILITVLLHYIGGESIIAFSVSYRSIGTNEWSEARNITAEQQGSSNLEWQAKMKASELANLHAMLELQVVIMNNNQLKTAGIYRENIDLPGAPKAVSFVTSDYNSITLRISLSDEGAQPLVSAEIVFLSDDHTNISTNVTTDTKSLQPGNDVDVVIGNLEENTEYRMAVAVYNYGGRGATSQFITSRTLARPPIPIYGIALLVAAAIALVAAVLGSAIVVFKKNINRKKKLRAYDVSKNGVRPLSPSHPVLHPTGSKRITTPTSPVAPPTPSTATSVLSPTTSPPAFYPPPPHPRQQSITDSQHGTPMGSHAHTFKYESESSRSTSVTQEDPLETVTQRYMMCSLPRSGEVTPQISHALDRMEGLRDQQHTPKMEQQFREPQTPYLHMDGRYVMSHDMLPSASSRSSRLGSADTNRSRMTGTSGLSSSSPFAQSSYSVNTAMTGMTSDTMSTHDGLMFARIETKKTDV